MRVAWHPKMLVLSHGIRRIRICQSTSTVSYRQFHVTPIRAIFVHACTADVETSSIDVLWPVAQWSRKGAHSAASLSVSSNRCGPDRSLPLPVQRLLLTDESPKDTSGVRLGRERKDSTNRVLGRDTSTRTCCMPPVGFSATRRDSSDSYTALFCRTAPRTTRLPADC
jgi:hypothetical protein